MASDTQQTIKERPRSWRQAPVLGDQSGLVGYLIALALTAVLSMIAVTVG